MVVLEPDQAKPVSWYLVGLEYARGVLKFSAPWKGIASPAPRDRNDSGGHNEGAEEQLLSRWAHTPAERDRGFESFPRYERESLNIFRLFLL